MGQTVTVPITLTVNGKQHSAEVEPRLLLAQFLRENLSMTGTHIGCDTTSCGACTVIIDGGSAKSCTILAVQANGSEITTVEGLADGDNLHPIQEGFWEKHGLQCGFCTPGFLMSSKALLETNANPTPEEIKEGLSGNICRCGTYPHVFEAVNSAAKKMRNGG